MIQKVLNYICRELPLWLIGLLTAWMPENLLTCKIRGSLSRPFFGKCGRGFAYGQRVRFIHPGKMSIGRNVYIAQDGWINAKGGVVLEDSVTIGPRCGIVTTFHKRSPEGFHVGLGAGGHGPIHVGQGSWIAMNAVITHGVNVGKACLIAASAVVTKDIPDGSTVGGIPARPLGKGAKQNRSDAPNV